jgi:hypothetical protein
MTQRRPHLALLAVISLFALCSSLGAQVPIREGLKLNEIHTHDPWILADQASHTYYLYNSAGPQLTVSRHCGILAYKSRDLETWSGPYSVFEIPDGSWANPAQVPWAPEVHLYSGRYYLFTTLHNQNAQLPADASAPSGNTTITVSYAGSHELHPRGTQVFVADSPLGPFKAIADAPIPPRSYTTLDGTLWVEDGTPYMVYAHEWLRVVDGQMEAIPMKPDLSAAAGSPFFLFKASDAPWLDDRTATVNTPQSYVTDGPELFRTRNGTLLMLWSSYQNGSYVEALAHSTSGKLKGPWKQDGILLGDDSGHGMIFQTFSGDLRLVVHHPFDGRLSHAYIYPIEDTGDTIRLKP